MPPNTYPPVPTNHMPQQAQAPPGMAAMPSLANLPPNILALLQHATLATQQQQQQQQQPVPTPAPSMPPPMPAGQYNMMSPPPAPDSNANPAANPAYQQLLAFLVSLIAYGQRQVCSNNNTTQASQNGART